MGTTRNTLCINYSQPSPKSYSGFLGHAGTEKAREDGNEKLHYDFFQHFIEFKKQG